MKFKQIHTQEQQDDVELTRLRLIAAFRKFEMDVANDIRRKKELDTEDDDDDVRDGDGDYC